MILNSHHLSVICLRCNVLHCYCCCAVWLYVILIISTGCWQAEDEKVNRAAVQCAAEQAVKQHMNEWTAHPLLIDHFTCRHGREYLVTRPHEHKCLSVAAMMQDADEPGCPCA
jgi:hypothetical protein